MCLGVPEGIRNRPFWPGRALRSLKPWLLCRCRLPGCYKQTDRMLQAKRKGTYGFRQNVIAPQSVTVLRSHHRSMAVVSAQTLPDTRTPEFRVAARRWPAPCHTPSIRCLKQKVRLLEQSQGNKDTNSKIPRHMWM